MWFVNYKLIISNKLSSFITTSKLIFVILGLITNICYSSELTVEIKGLPSEQLQKYLLEDLSIFSAKNEPNLSEERIENLFIHAKKEIESTLNAWGYYDFQINPLLKKTTQGNFVAKYNINLGQFITINSIDIKIIGPGKSNSNLIKEINTPLLTIGKQLNHKDYEDTKEYLLTKIRELGYLNSKFTFHEIQINRNTYKANIIISIDTGKQYYFGNVTFKNGLYSNKLLNRFIPFNNNDPYTLEKLTAFRKNLEDSDLFKKVRIDPTPDLNDPNQQTIPIIVRLIPKGLNRYTGSIGYGTDTGPRGGLAWHHRRVSQPGHQVNFGVQASRILKRGYINYIIPGRRPATDRYSIDMDVKEEIVKNIYSRRSALSANKIKKINNVEHIWSISYFSEVYRLDPDQEKTRHKYLVPMTKYTWTNPYEINDLSYGNRLTLITRAALDVFFSATDMLQIEAQGKSIHPLWNNSRLILRGALGTTIAGRFDNLPPSLRFFTGGDGSVRGFHYNELGDKQINPSGKIVNQGGRHLVVVSSEVDQKIYGDLSGAIFIDAGNAFKKFNKPMGVGAGVGLRWHTPIGSFRIDVAKPLNNQAEKRDLRFHLTFGTDL